MPAGKILSPRALMTTEDLRELELFQFVAPESIEGILDACSVQELKKNDVLLDVGQSSRHLFLILSGRVRIHLADVGTEPIAVLERGEAIGEISLADRAEGCLIGVADCDSRLLVLEEDLLWSLVQVSHAAACNLLKILTRRTQGSSSRISDRLRLENEIHLSCAVDPLSGLHNRHWLQRILARLLRRAEYGGHHISLLLFDIDHCKRFNDHHGHMCGDRAIQALGRVLAENLRPGELAARYGGDQFLVLLPGVDDSRAFAIGERIRRKVLTTELVLEDGRRLPPMTLSIGLARSRRGSTVDESLAAAEAALCRAKAKGRNVVSD